MDTIRTLLCWNRGDTDAAMFWHQAAQGARIVTIDELGGACRIAVQPAAGIRTASLLPPELSYLEHGGQADPLREALVRLFGGARSLRVLAADAIDDPSLFAAALAAFRPDVVSTAAGWAADAGSDLAPLATPGVAAEVRGREAMRPFVDSWCRDFLERGRRRRGTTTRYRVDELVAVGVDAWRSDAPPAITRVRPGQPAALLVPGCGGGAVGLTLQLLAEPVCTGAAIWLRIDGGEVAVRAAHDRIEAPFIHVSPATCHLLEVGCEGPGAGRALVGVEIGPAR